MNFTGQLHARPLEDWDEEMGDVLWWRFPIEEPPWIGSPLDTGWPLVANYVTHWTPIPIPPKPWPSDSANDQAT